MLAKLQQHLAAEMPFLKEKKLLVTVSGGVDSMVLATLLQKLDYNISLAHCNFKLRGDESDADEEFVEQFAKRNNLDIFVTRFETERFASDNKLSIQVAARQLRYVWFHQLIEENQLDYILTAHHADDSLETFLIHLSRGTGLDGLTGIPQINQKIVRPLLPFSRDEIETFARENQINWREDSSNASEKYVRNKLRQQMVPLLKTLNPNFLDSFQQTLHHLQQAKSMVEDASVLIYQQVVTERENKKFIRLFDLKRLPNYEAYLFHWLQPFGFTAWPDIYALVEAQSGKYVLSGAFRLLKDRDFLILEQITPKDENEYLLHADETAQLPFPISTKTVDTWEISGNRNRIYVDKEKLKLPLVIRKWQEGDYFCPFGMHGTKKLSKYFKDEKMSLSDKTDKWVLLSDNQVIWIIENAQDRRFKIDAATTQILQIEVL